MKSMIGFLTEIFYFFEKRTHKSGKSQQ